MSTDAAVREEQKIGETREGRLYAGKHDGNRIFILVNKIFNAQSRDEALNFLKQNGCEALTNDELRASANSLSDICAVGDRVISSSACDENTQGTWYYDVGADRNSWGYKNWEYKAVPVIREKIGGPAPK